MTGSPDETVHEATVEPTTGPEAPPATPAPASPVDELVDTLATAAKRWLADLLGGQKP